MLRFQGALQKSIFYFSSLNHIFLELNQPLLLCEFEQTILNQIRQIQDASRKFQFDEVFSVSMVLQTDLFLK